MARAACSMFTTDAVLSKTPGARSVPSGAAYRGCRAHRKHPCHVRGEDNRRAAAAALRTAQVSMLSVLS